MANDLLILQQDRNALPAPATYLAPEQDDYLKRPTPKGLIKHRTIKGGAQAQYVDVHAFEDGMDYVFGRLWSFTVDSKEVIEGYAVVQGHVTVHVPVKNPETQKVEFKDITKSQFGGSELKKMKSGGFLDIGNDFKAAASDCFKKCCVQFGLFRDVYMKESDAIARAERYEKRKAQMAETAKKDAVSNLI